MTGGPSPSPPGLLEHYLITPLVHISGCVVVYPEHRDQSIGSSIGLWEMYKYFYKTVPDIHKSTIPSTHRGGVCVRVLVCGSSTHPSNIATTGPDAMGSKPYASSRLRYVGTHL